MSFDLVAPKAAPHSLVIVANVAVNAVRSLVTRWDA